MKVTKLGHCCLLIETKGLSILTDPGAFTVEAVAKLTKIDYVLYTHEHYDHYHLDSLKTLLAHNPNIKIFANVSVGDLLEKESIPYTLVEDGSELVLGTEVTLAGIGKDHAIIHPSLPHMDNVGFYLDKRLWYPGDSFTNPNREVEILALPVAGPWMKFSEAIDYALMLKPKVVFPVHDAIVVPMLRQGMLQRMPKTFFEPQGIGFVPLDEGDSYDFL